MADDTQFDPLAFLNTTVPSAQYPAVSQEVLEEMHDYLVTKIVEMLPAGVVGVASTSEELFSIAKKNIPDFEKCVNEWMEEFRKEYLIQYG